ncbi:MAG: hypothetical protein IT180_10815 [Acidobacteria bacterium]|nr:hypothetical protein [Acidobacteriota bacterium]
MRDWRRHRAAIALKHPRHGQPEAFADQAARYRRRHGLAALERATYNNIVYGRDEP